MDVPFLAVAVASEARLPFDGTALPAGPSEANAVVRLRWSMAV